MYGQGQPGAFGAYDTSRLPQVMVAFAEMNAAIAATPNVAEIVAARKSAFEAKSEDFEAFVDAVDLAERIQATTTDPAVRAKAAAFASALDAMIVAGGAPNYADEATHARAHGINLLFMRPDLTGRFADPDGFDQASAWPAEATSFYEETGWPHDRDEGLRCVFLPAAAREQGHDPRRGRLRRARIDCSRRAPSLARRSRRWVTSSTSSRASVFPVVDALEHGDQSAAAPLAVYGQLQSPRAEGVALPPRR